MTPTTNITDVAITSFTSTSEIDKIIALDTTILYLCVDTTTNSIGKTDRSSSLRFAITFMAQGLVGPRGIGSWLGPAAELVLQV